MPPEFEAKPEKETEAEAQVPPVAEALKEIVGVVPDEHRLEVEV